MFASRRADADAEFVELYRAEFDRCVRVARRVAFADGDVEDLAIEAFTRAYARWPRLRRHASPSAWVLRTTINLAIDANRRKTPELAPEHSPDRTSESETRIILNACLRRLSARQRDVVVLRHLVGLPTSEVATALGTSEGTVKTHLHRGLARLHTDLGAAGLQGELINV